MAFKNLSAVYKAAHKGKDIGKKNVPGKTGFNTVAAKATKEGYSKEVAQKIAGSVFKKVAKKAVKG